MIVQMSEFHPNDLSSNLGDLASPSEDVLNTLNGFGLGASDVFVKLVSRSSAPDVERWKNLPIGDGDSMNHPVP